MIALGLSILNLCAMRINAKIKLGQIVNLVEAIVLRPYYLDFERQKKTEETARIKAELVRQDKEKDLLEAEAKKLKAMAWSKYLGFRR